MADSKTVVNRLYQVDPQFVELVDTLFGGSVDPTDVWGWMYTREGQESMPVSKMNPAPSDIATRAKGVLKPLGYAVGGGVIANQLPQNQKDSRRIGRRKFSIRTPEGQERKYDSRMERNVDALMMSEMQRWNKRVKKSDEGTEVVWDVEFSKVDDEKRQVFGWASIVKMDGKPVIDRQGDLIDADEIEKAAYSYVQKSRRGGNQHRREGEEPFQASDMIESIVFTDEKVAKMGLPDDFPRGWWVGYQVHDEPTWQDIKAGRKTGFSIHGRGRRKELAA